MIDLIQGRKSFQAIGNTYPVAGNIIRKDTTVAGVPCAWFTPPSADDENIIIYIHGGAFIFGSIDSHAPLVSYIAQELRRKLLLIEYRLAPEHPFPAAVDDCVAVINGVREVHPHLNFGIIGDSAGGNIAMSTGLALKETNGPGPQYTIVLSPWVDLECKNASYQRNKMMDTALGRSYLLEAAELYANGRDLFLPLLSPVNANFQGFAPVLIFCGTAEILEDDAIILHKQLSLCGVKAELKRFAGEQHVWPFMDIDTDAARRALNDMSKFVAQASDRRLSCQSKRDQQETKRE